VRAACQAAESHGCRAIPLVVRGEVPVTLGAATAMAYLAIRRRGVASSAMTSVMMFIST
jgi:fructoselysine-6-P-deglycase FrlB-like protein